MLHFALSAMHVLLLRPVPGQRTIRPRPVLPHRTAGMEYIAAALEARGHRVAIADLRFSAPARTAAPPHAARHVVGIAGMHALETDDVLALAREVRAARARHADRARRPHRRGVSGSVPLGGRRRRRARRWRARDAARSSRRWRRAAPLRDVPGLALSDGSGGDHPHRRRTRSLRARCRAASGPASRRRLAPPVCLPRPSSDLAGRDRARLPVPLLLLLDLAAARALGARALDRVGLPGHGQLSATTSSSPTICSGITRRAARRWRSSCAAAASARNGSWSRAGSTSSPAMPTCSRRGGRSRRSSTSSSASRPRPTRA